MVGDFLVDHYVYGRPVRLSREAPVVVLAHEGESRLPGGAGNTAANVASLGAAALAVGVVGADPEGGALAEDLARRGVDVSGLVRGDGWVTPTKTRILAGDRNARKNQMLRLEREPSGPPSAAVLERLPDRLETAARSAGAVVLSDYGYGVATPALGEAIRRAARRVPVVVDSRRQSLVHGAGAILTPNEQEGADASGVAIEGPESALAAARTLRERAGARAVVLTRGALGMVVCGDGVEQALPAVGPRHAVDGTGAGDTVSSVLAVALALGADLPTAALLAAHAAGIVVMKIGTATASRAELEASIAEYE